MISLASQRYLSATGSKCYLLCPPVDHPSSLQSPTPSASTQSPHHPLHISLFMRMKFCMRIILAFVAISLCLASHKKHKGGPTRIDPAPAPSSKPFSSQSISSSKGDGLLAFNTKHPNFLIGVAVESSQLNGPMDSCYTSNFNLLVAENEG